MYVNLNSLGVIIILKNYSFSAERLFFSSRQIIKAPAPTMKKTPGNKLESGNSSKKAQPR